MPTPILMPALSPTMTEGKLARWLKQPGEAVRAGDVLAEIETDKATMEVEAVDEGTLARILVAEGTEGVKVNTPIAELSGTEDELKTADKEVRDIVADAAEFAQNDAEPDPSELWTDIVL